MKKEIEKDFLNKADLFKALGHPTRLIIIDSVKDKRRSVKELTEIVGVDISTMSKHLDILKRNGIIQGEKEKNYIYYHLSIPCVLEFMTCAVKVINKR